MMLGVKEHQVGNYRAYVPINHLRDQVMRTCPEGMAEEALLPWRMKVAEDLEKLDLEELIRLTRKKKMGGFVKNSRPILKTYPETALSTDVHKDVTLVVTLSGKVIDSHTVSAIIDYTWMKEGEESC